MPPKGKGAKGKAPVIIDGVNTSEMTREQLEVFALRLKEELEREREERNFFQLERDKLRTYWNITRNELEEKDAELRTKNGDMREINEKHSDELKKFRQMAKNIKFEKELALANFRTTAKAAARKEVVAHAKEIRTLLEEKRDLKLRLKDNRARYTEVIKANELHQKTILCAARQNLLEKLDWIMEEFDETLEIFEENIPKQYMLMVRDLEEKYNNELGSLIKTYNDAITEDRGYFNDIIQNNLGLMSAMKSQLDKYFVLSHRQEMLLDELMQENKEMKEPLQKSKSQINHLKSLVKSCQRNNSYLQKKKIQFEQLSHKHDLLKAKLISERMHFGQIQNFTDEVRDEFHKRVFDVKVQERMNNEILQERIKQVTNFFGKGAPLAKALKSEPLCLGPLCQHSCLEIVEAKYPKLIGLLKSNPEYVWGDVDPDRQKNPHLQTIYPRRYIT